MEIVGELGPEIISLPRGMPTREQIVEAARSQLKVRWQHQACAWGVALDCIGLIAATAVFCHVQEGEKFRADRRYTHYSPRPDRAKLFAACNAYLDPIHRPLVLADILVMEWPGEMLHFGLVSNLAPLQIIHAYAQARCVVENGMDEVWQKRIIARYTFRGLDGGLRLGAAGAPIGGLSGAVVGWSVG